MAFCSSLRAHHTSEDRLAFPRLEREFPELAPALAKLREDHKTALLDTNDTEHVQADLDRLATQLEAHFAYEEEHLLTGLDELR